VERVNVATDARVLIVDSDIHGAQALARLLEQHGYPAPELALSVWKAMESVEDSLPDVVVFSLYYPNVDPLLFCRALKQAHPRLPIMVITSSGASLGEIESLGVLAGGLDAVLERPLDEARFLAVLQEVLAKRKLLTPSSIRDAAQGISHREPSVELAARTILFTDVRGSTQLLETTTTQMFFKELNYRLTQQGAVVRQFSGNVVKFTGDGLMASFQGFDRLTQAVRCALKIVELEKEQAYQHLPMPFGQGLCDGLVVCGFVGEAKQERPDIFGWPVHLAARLCGHAPAGTILMKKKDFDRIDANGIPHTHAGFLEFRGVKEPVECVQIGLLAPTESLHHG
jgi:class 3 adenylate cyclase